MMDFVCGLAIFRGHVERIEGENYVHGAIVTQEVGKYVDPVVGFQLQYWAGLQSHWATVARVW